MSKHFISIEELSDADLDSVYRLARAPIDDVALKGQGVALVFEHPSLRTRASSSSAVHELGGFATFFSDEEIGLDSRESAEDVARTLGEMYAIAALRVRNHAVFERMRRATRDRMSLINLLSDCAHPTQAVADVLTVAEYFADGDVHALAGLEVAYVGDATNVTRSLAGAMTRLGVNVSVGAPEGYQLNDAGPENPKSITATGTLRLTDSASTPMPGSRWGSRTRRTVVVRISPGSASTRHSSRTPRSPRSSCTVCQPIAARRSRTTCSTGRRRSCGARSFIGVRR